MVTGKKQSHSITELDPRMKLLLVVVFTTSTYISPNIGVLIWNYVLILSLYLLRGLWKGAGKTGILFTALILTQYLAAAIPVQGISNGLGMIVFFLQRMAVFFVMGSWISVKLRISDFVTAMQNMRLPKGFIITLAVIFRYLPTIREEFRCITNTMRLRGIGVNLKSVLLHPLKTSEYAVVPLVIRSMTVADELSASAMTRGLDLETKRSSYRIVRLGAWDVLFTFGMIAALAGGFMISLLLQRG